MEISVAGAIVTLAALLLGWAAGAPLIVGLFLTLPLQSTAIVSFPALGQSSAPVAALFAAMIVTAEVMRRGSLSRTAASFSDHWAGVVLLVLTLYLAVGAYFLPRIFEGRTSAFVPLQGAIFEVPLSPVGGNIAQAMYLVLGAATFGALGAALVRDATWTAVRRGFFVLVSVHALAGCINFAGNIAGLGDVLAPLRTAGYAMLADQQEGGLWRIVGGSPETSAFSALALACLAFSVTYWRWTGSRAALGLAAIELCLLLLSTSTTAYVGLAVLGGALAICVASNACTGRMMRRDLHLLAVVGGGAIVVLVTAMAIPALMEGTTDLIDNMVFKKALSASGQERGYWNSQSLKAFFDTNGLGVGLGSSRASSWVVAVLSQGGVVGAVGFAALVAAVWLSKTSVKDAAGVEDFRAAVRAAVFASLMAATMSASNVDPGLLVFAGLAICLAVRGDRGSKANIGTDREAPNYGAPAAIPIS